MNAFFAALKERFKDPTSVFGKAYLRLLVDEIKLDGNQFIVRGTHRGVADAIGFMPSSLSARAVAESASPPGHRSSN